ncbi:MAG: alpha/beta hydrolase [Hyphomicrobiaceae bacterium]|nr:alpha/beta hydrolase [Hyphomicrobiaceae bacterium]
MAPLIHYTRKGHGAPPLVLVHGFGCARSDWDAVVGHFASRHETVAVDLGGHGETPGGLEHRRIETHGEDVAELLRSLKLPPAIVLGHSMGCRVAMEAALRAPQFVKAVVLVDGSRLGTPGSTAHIDRAKAMEQAGYGPFIKGAFEQMFAPGFDKDIVSGIVQRALDRDPAIAGPLFIDIGRYDAENMDRVLESLTVPLLAIQTTWTNAQGQRVSMTAGQTTPYLDLIRRAVPKALIEVIPDTGHFPQLERPAETNAIIESFLRGLPA